MSVLILEDRAVHTRTPSRQNPSRQNRSRPDRARQAPVREAPVRKARIAQPRSARQRVAQPDPNLRLTPRGRVAAFLASILVLAALVIGAGQMVEATSGGGAGEPVAVVVGAGDTLWGIAKEIAPDRDPRSVVQQIRSLNDLGTRSIVPGQSILVPVAG